MHRSLTILWRQQTDPASIAQGIVEDHADIQNDQAENQKQQANKSKGLSTIIKEHYPKWLLYCVLVLLNSHHCYYCGYTARFRQIRHQHS